MRSKRLLHLVESEIIAHNWDNGENEYWEEVLNNEIRFIEKTGATINLGEVSLLCESLIHLAKCTLCAITASELDDFESLSDCLHAKDSVQFFPAPELALSLLNLLCKCLDLVEKHRDPDPQFAITKQDLSELLEHLREANKLATQRAIYESTIAQTVITEKQEIRLKSENDKKKMTHARAHRDSKHDWERVSMTESELLKNGKPKREWAGIIERRFGIPRSTYLEWRKRCSSHFKKTTV